MSWDVQNPTFCDDGVDWQVDTGAGEEYVITYSARTIRGEKTGMKAMISVMVRDTILSYDTFNVTRSEERRKLVTGAQKMMGDDLTSLYDTDQMRHDLDLICLYLANQYEASRVEITEFDPKVIYLPPREIVGGCIQKDASTNFFGPPASLKSYLLIAMSVSIAQGINTLWDVERSPVLYINLERSESSFGRREFMIRQALGVKEKSGVRYIHARGYRLSHVLKSARKFARENPGCVVFLDSISRAVEGKLIDDQVGNQFTNDMNSLECTWAGCGHTPKSGDSLFGSRMFEAGEDIGVKVTAGKHAATRGVCLEVVKGNDIAYPEPAYLAFDFDPAGSGLMGIRKTVDAEFPDINKKGGVDDEQRLIDYVEANYEASTVGASTALKMDAAKVSRFFTKSGRYTQTRRDGHEKMYALKDDADKAEIS